MRRVTGAREYIKEGDRPPVALPRLGEGMLDQALAGSGDGAFVVAADGRIVLWNHSAERILGYTAQEVIGRPSCDIFVGRDDDGKPPLLLGVSRDDARQDGPAQSPRLLIDGSPLPSAPLGNQFT